MDFKDAMNVCVSVKHLLSEVNDLRENLITLAKKSLKTPVSMIGSLS